MYIDALSQDAQLIVSKKAIKLFGRDAAIYWSALSGILWHVREKESFDSSGFFRVDRAWVEEQTSLTAEEQIACEAALAEWGIVARSPDDPCKISVSAEAALAALVGESVRELKPAKKPAPKARAPRLSAEDKAAAKKLKEEQREAKRREKDEIVRATMKRICCQQFLSQEAKDAACRWVDSIYDSKRYLNRDKIQMFASQIKARSSDPKAQAAIIDVAVANSWQDGSWAVSSYDRSLGAAKSSQSQSLGEQRVASSKSDLGQSF